MAPRPVSAAAAAAMSLLACMAGPASASSHCKAIPGTASWPCAADWQSLNHTVGGRLLKPSPPASVCHPDWPNYNAAACLALQPKLTDGGFFADDPLSGDFPNWNNDSCLASPQDPCSGEGFPVYVVNASTPQHVAAGINFARQRNVRLNVKGSGHDYLGRSTAPNSLSIWTRYIRGITFHSAFTPSRCKDCHAVPAVTLGSGEEWGDIYVAASAHNLTFVGGTGDSIGLGGYLTGGGHSPLSQVYGMAADQILEIEAVTPSGQVVTANQVQNTDLFWALRGGGGATFGVMTHITIKTFPEMPMTSLAFSYGAAFNSDAWWTTVSYIMQNIPKLQDNGISTVYSYIVPSYPYEGTQVSAFIGQALMPNGTVEKMTQAVAFIQDYINKNYPLQITVTGTPVQYASVYEYYEASKNTDPVGQDQAIGSRLLDGKALKDASAIKKAIQGSIPPGQGANLNMVAGPGTWHAKPAGGSDSVNPSWRSAYAHYVVGVSWTPLNETEKQTLTNQLTNRYMPYIRELAPDMGAYVNEADVHEPDFQHVFWGANYARLLSIKRQLDPEDVFWCAACVGNENWKMQENNLCHV